MGDLEKGWKRLFCVSTRLERTPFSPSDVDGVLTACAVDAVRLVVWDGDGRAMECQRRGVVSMRIRGIARLFVTERRCARHRWQVYLDDIA